MCISNKFPLPPFHSFLNTLLSSLSIYLPLSPQDQMPICRANGHFLGRIDSLDLFFMVKKLPALLLNPLTPVSFLVFLDRFS